MFRTSFLEKQKFKKIIIIVQLSKFSKSKGSKKRRRIFDSEMSRFIFSIKKENLTLEKAKRQAMINLPNGYYVGQFISLAYLFLVSRHFI
jgi:hypothetical protein